MTSAIMDAYSFDEYSENIYENGTDGKSKRKKVVDIDIYNNTVKKICNENNGFPSPPSYGSRDNYFSTKDLDDSQSSPVKTVKQEISDNQSLPCSMTDTTSQQQQQTLMPKKEHFPQALHLSLPQKVELDSSVSNLQWLQNLGSAQNDQNSQSRQPHAIATQQISHPQSQASVHNNNNNNIQIINLPSNVQISNGTIQYVNNRSQNPPVLISSKTEPSQTVMRSQPFNPVSYPTASYLMSPNSAKPTSTVADPLYPKPPYSYSCLIALALKNSSTGSLPVAEIYNFMTRNFPYFKTAPDGWKNSVRHNLSLNKCFEKIENPNSDGINSRKGCLWALNPHKLKKMDEEILKWSRKDNNAIKRAMPNPDILEVLEKGQELSLPNRSSHINHQMNQYNVNHPIHPTQSPYLLPSGGAMRMMRSGSMSSSTYSHPSPTLQSNNGINHDELSSHNNSQLLNNHRHNQQTSSERMLSSYNIPSSTHQTENNMSGYQFHADQEFNLDPSLTELAIQSGIWDDLPSDLLDLPFSNSPMHLSPANKYTVPSTDGAADQNVSDQRVINAT